MPAVRHNHTGPLGINTHGIRQTDDTSSRERRAVMTKHITPRYKLMLFYDLTGKETEAYYHFVMSEMVPALHEMGLYIFRAFHTIPGPQGSENQMRQVEFVAEELATIREALGSEKWQGYEKRLLEHSANYSRKIVHFRQGFQL